MFKMENQPFAAAPKPSEKHGKERAERGESDEARRWAEGLKKNLEDFFDADENEDVVMFGSSLIQKIEDYFSAECEARGLSGDAAAALGAEVKEHNQMVNSYDGYIFGDMLLNGEKVFEYQVNTDGEGIVIKNWNSDALERACRVFLEKLG